MPINYAAIGSDAIATALTSRLEIRSYSDPERRKRQWNRGFVAPINPESVKITYKNTLAGQVGLNSTGASLSVASNQAEEISFKLVLTDSSSFHYSGRNSFTPMNNYEADHFSNGGYTLGTPLRLVNDFKTGIGNELKVRTLNSGKYRNALLDVPLGDRDGHVATAIQRFLNLTTQPALQGENGDFQAPYLGVVWGRVFNRPGRLSNERFADSSAVAEGASTGAFLGGVAGGAVGFASAVLAGNAASSSVDGAGGVAAGLGAGVAGLVGGVAASAGIGAAVGAAQAASAAPIQLPNQEFLASRQKVYPCYLESVDVNYTHFTRDGRVLRAELDCVFKEDSTDNG